MWTAEQVATFLSWSAAHTDPEQRTAWVLLIATGMRRGELLALRWRDLDLDGSIISVRRSVGTVKTKGEHQRAVEGPTTRPAGLASSTSTGTPRRCSAPIGRSGQPWRFS